ncbi:MAG: primosomal protein N', partial [Rikenellaceae bacterium]|nr:primosomal protein N' [Rikenellaceae bacterium]
VMRSALPAKMKPSGLSNEEFEEDEFRVATERTVSIAPEYCTQEALNECFERISRRAPKQYAALLEIVDRLTNNGQIDFEGEVRCRTLEAAAPTLKALADKGLVLFHEREREATFGSTELHASLPTLSEAQTVALDSIREQHAATRCVLLHGVTGSGKTEIYIHLIAKALEQGGDAVMLVPEIALTEQLIARLQRYFGDRVVPYHSKLTDTRRTDIYLRLMRSEAGRLIVGTRSALLLPLQHPRLIVVDEEHDASYKQNDPAPRYNARDTAVVAAAMYDCPIVLGSATPSIESFMNAHRGKYGYTSLTERYGGATMPRIIISDTLRAAKRGERHAHFNKALIDRLTETLAEGGQAMLFQNRRGFSPYVECTECGRVIECPHCNVALTYHRQDNSLRCHYCGYRQPMPNHCPSCHVADVTLRGFGTEKVEEELAKIFPQASIDRLDRDSATSQTAYNQIIHRFESGATDILIGTQMITKGFDFSQVRVVGILNADNLLNYPDFRASERAFQLITQVAGRAGRRKESRNENPNEACNKQSEAVVILQTSQPAHPVIRQAAEYDYLSMVNAQLRDREAFHYPPYAHLINVTMRHRDPSTLREAARKLGEQLREVFGSRVLGPQSPPVDRINGVYILGFMIKVENSLSFSRARALLRKEIETIRRRKEWNTINIFCDVDPQ